MYWFDDIGSQYLIGKYVAYLMKVIERTWWRLL